MKEVIIRNNKLVSKAFWESLNNLMDLNVFDGKTTMSLFKIRKEFVEEVQNIKTVTQTSDINVVRELMDADSSFPLAFSLDIEKIAGHLSSNDLFQLEVLFQKEEL